MAANSKEKLINAVKEHTCLYDFSCKEYRDEALKKETWKKIASTLNANAENEKDFVTGDMCHKRWKSLRDIYVRKKKKIESGQLMGSPNNIPRWEYWDLISWMDNYRKRSYNNANSESADNSYAMSPSPLFDEQQESSVLSTNHVSQATPPKKRIMSADNKEDVALDLCKNTNAKKTSDDKFDLFGKSVAIQLRELKSPYLAMKAQTDIQNVIFSAFCTDRDGVQDEQC